MREEGQFSGTSECKAEDWFREKEVSSAEHPAQLMKKDGWQHLVDFPH